MPMTDKPKPAGRPDLRAGDDRRSGGDRRKVNLGAPPPGAERRTGDRRTGRDRRKDAKSEVR